MQDVGYDSQSAPPPPTLGTTTGSSPTNGTFYVSVTLDDASGNETAAGPVSVISVSSGHLLTVSLPSGVTTGTTFHVYVGTAPGVLSEQATAGSAGSTWTEPTSGITRTMKR